VDDIIFCAVYNLFSCVQSCSNGYFSRTYYSFNGYFNLAQPLRRTSTSQSQRSTSSSSTGQVGSWRPRILCLECGRLCSQRQNGSVHRHNCMVQLTSDRQHQHSSPAHIVIPAVNPISAPRLATSSHGNNASPQQPNALLPPPTNTPPADIIVQLPGSIHLAPPTHLEANHNHPHLPLMPRPPSAQPRLTIHQWATSHFHLLRLACASRTRGEFCDALLAILCHNPPKTAVLPHEDNSAMIHDPVTPPNPLDADYGHFQAAPPSHKPWRLYQGSSFPTRLRSCFGWRGSSPYCANQQVPSRLKK
jgi:hypothetical protein